MKPSNHDSMELFQLDPETFTVTPFVSTPSLSHRFIVPLQEGKGQKVTKEKNN